MGLQRGATGPPSELTGVSSRGGAFKNAKRSPSKGAGLAGTGDMKSFALLQMNVHMGLEKSIIIEKQSGLECLYRSTVRFA